LTHKWLDLENDILAQPPLGVKHTFCGFVADFFVTDFPGTVRKMFLCILKKRDGLNWSQLVIFHR
jgi:hypothetical protein